MAKEIRNQTHFELSFRSSRDVLFMERGYNVTISKKDEYIYIDLPGWFLGLSDRLNERKPLELFYFVDDRVASSYKISSVNFCLNDVLFFLDRSSGIAYCSTLPVAKWLRRRMLDRGCLDFLADYCVWPR